MSSAASPHRRGADRVLETMENYTLWTCGEVQSWVKLESEGDPILEKDIEKNLYALNEFNGRFLEGAKGQDLLMIGISNRSKDVLMECIEGLRNAEDKLRVRRTRYHTIRNSLISRELTCSVVDRQAVVEMLRASIRPAITDTPMEEVAVAILQDMLQRCCNASNDPPAAEVLRYLTEFDLMKVLGEIELAERAYVTFKSLDREGRGQLSDATLPAFLSAVFPAAGPTVLKKLQLSVFAGAQAERGVGFPSIMADPYVKALAAASNNIPQAPDAESSALPERPRSSARSRSSSPSVTTRCTPRSPRLASRVTGSLAALTPSKSPRVVKSAHTDLQPNAPPMSLVEQAEDILDDKICSSTPWLEALELFTDAAAQFKSAGDWIEAAMAFQRSADCFQRLERKPEAAQAMKDAGYCFRESCCMREALDCLTEAADLYIEMNRTFMGAKLLYCASELHELLGELEEGADKCAAAAELLQNMRKQPFVPSDSARLDYCTIVKAAQLYTKLHLWDEAHRQCVRAYDFILAHNEEYKTMAHAALHPQLAAYLLFLAQLCLMASLDPFDARNAGNKTPKGPAVLPVDKLNTSLLKYSSIDWQSKEHELLLSLKEAILSNDYRRAVAAFDRWKIKSGNEVDVWMQYLIDHIYLMFRVGSQS